MKPKKVIPADIDSLIIEVRGHKVILDSALAGIYGVPTKRLNEQLRRNLDRFPADFAFQITRQEWQDLKSHAHTPAAELADAQELMPNRSQFATGSHRHRDPRSQPYVFTEHGAIMAATILNSPRAVQMSLFVVRAFVKMRDILTDTRELARKLAALEHELKNRLDIHEAAIVDILQRIMRILDIPRQRPLRHPNRQSHKSVFISKKIRFPTRSEENPLAYEAEVGIEPTTTSSIGRPG